MPGTADLTPDNDRPRVTIDDRDVGTAEPPQVEWGAPDDLETPEPVTEEEIRRAIGFLGRNTHRLAGHPDLPDHWDFTADETDDLAGPLTGLVNRFDWLAAFIRRGDLIILVLTLVAWVGRNRRISADLEEYAAEPEQPPPTGPEGPAMPQQPWDQV